VATRAQRTLLKPTLDGLYDSFNMPDSATDPIQVVRRFSRNDDREVVAFCAAGLAFGRVTSVLQSIQRLVDVMGEFDDPAMVTLLEPLRPHRHRAVRLLEVTGSGHAPRRAARQAIPNLRAL